MSTPKHAAVLFVGMDHDEYSRQKVGIKASLQSEDNGWNFTPNLGSTFGEALRSIRDHRDLDLVHLSDSGLSRSEMMLGCEEMVVALAARTTPPWVVIEDPNLTYLEPIFKIKGIRVAGGVESATQERWKELSGDAQAA